MNQKYVYHASKTGGLKKLEPRISTHGRSWIYATKDIVTSAMFLGDNSDFICQTGTSNGKPQIYERFKGALRLAYKGKRGSIYCLPTKTFIEDQTHWSAEVVSEVPVNIVSEIKIKDALDYLEKLEKKGMLIIYRYPEFPPYTPVNKADIIEKGVSWTIDDGENQLDQVEQFHPDILNKVIAKLKQKGYKPKTRKWKKYFYQNIKNL